MARRPPNRKGRQGKPVRKRSAGRRLLMMCISVLCISMFMFAAPAVIVMLIGMVPTVVALIIDRDPEKYTAMSVGAANFAGVVPFVVELLVGNPTMTHAFAMLTDVFVVVVMYGAAAAGWVLVFVLPPVAAVLLRMSADSKIARLRSEQAKLVAEWGREVALAPQGPEEGEAPAK